jgi:hypothetical protein
MSTFKLSKKDAVSDTRTNIYDLHERKISYFEKEKGKLDEYKELLQEYTKSINETNDLEYKVVLHGKIDSLKEKITNITDDTELNDYLLDFFAIIHNNNKDTSKQTNKVGQMDTFVQSELNTTKIDMYNEYIKKFNDELKEIKNDTPHKTNSCEYCGSTRTGNETKTSTVVCLECGNSKNVLFNDNEIVPVYTENIEQVILFNYKRNNHFQECLNQLQAKENTSIPPQIIKDLTFEFKKYNIHDPKMITASLVKIYLKKLKYNKYYEHIPTIINEFCGLHAPKLTPELEQQLKIMFDEIQIPFEKYSRIICPKRKNFLNYNYIFYKMCQLLCKDEFLNFFPLLKSREKLYEHDLIWRGICNDLRWEYIPSI